ncbi:hypothetical protein [Endozoicomonas sp.]|uniref:hypothetical protein n=1 Tax=Endozoicomonas sp. TaxID=1892382 RepID=UPI003AF9D8D6
MLNSYHKDLIFDVEALDPESYTFYLVPSLNFKDKLLSYQDFYPDNLVLKFKTDCQSIADLESTYNIELLPFSEQECDGVVNLGLFPEQARLEFNLNHRVALEESYLDIGGQQYFLTSELFGVSGFSVEESESLDAGFLAAYPPVGAVGHETKFWLFHRSVVREKNNCDLSDFNWDQDEYDRCQKEFEVISSPQMKKARKGGRLRNNEKKRIEKELERYSNYFSAEVRVRSELVDSGNSPSTLSLSNPGHRIYIPPSMLTNWTRVFIAANVNEKEKYARWLRFFFLTLFTASNFMEVYAHWDVISDLFLPVIGYIKFDPHPYELLALSCSLNFAIFSGRYEFLWSAYSQFIDLVDAVYNNKNYGLTVSSYFDLVMAGILSTFTSIWDLLGYFRKELVGMSSLPWPTIGTAERTVHQGRLRGISNVEEWEVQLSQWKAIRLMNMRMEQKRRRKKLKLKIVELRRSFTKRKLNQKKLGKN